MLVATGNVSSREPTARALLLRPTNCGVAPQAGGGPLLASLAVGVIVLGSHRSGTSAITELVSTFGFDVGSSDSLLPPTDANRRGYFELLSLMKVNDSILAEAGGTVFDPPTQTNYEAQLGHSAKDYLDAFRAEHPGDRYVWKDPRLSLTFTLWREILPKPDLVVLMVRHPLAVAESLGARGDVPDAPGGVALWEAYTRAAIRSCVGLPVLVVDYDTMVSNPASAGESLAAAFTSLDVEYIDQPIVSSSVLDASSARSGHAQCPLAEEQLRLWEQVSAMVGFHPRLDAIEDNELSVSARQVFAVRRTLTQLPLEQLREVARLSDGADTLAGNLDSLQSDLDEANAQIERLTGERIQRNKELLAAIDGAKAAEASRGAALGRLAVAEHELQANHYHHARWEEEVAFLRHTTGTADQRVKDIEQSTSWKLTQAAGRPIRFLRRLTK